MTEEPGEEVIRGRGGSGDHLENSRNVHHRVSRRLARMATGEGISMSDRSTSTLHCDHREEGTVGVRAPWRD
jgi:hypothetical protein